MRITPLHPAILSLLVLAAPACSDNTSAPSDIVLTYDDGSARRLATDSAVVSIAVDSSLIARAFFPPTGSPDAFRLELSVDSLGGLSLPPGTYDLGSGSPLLMAASFRNSTLIAVPTSGTVTVSTSTSSAITGSLDLAFHYIQFPVSAPAPFTLKGRFRFTFAGVGAVR